MCICLYTPPVSVIMAHASSTRQSLVCFLWAHNVALGVITVALNVFSEELRPINTHILPKPKPSSMTPSASGFAAFVETECYLNKRLFDIVTLFS